MLSNLLWWPWVGKETPFIPPVVPDYFPMGGNPEAIRGMKRRERQECDDEDFLCLLAEV